MTVVQSPVTKTDNLSRRLRDIKRNTRSALRQSVVHICESVIVWSHGPLFTFAESPYSIFSFVCKFYRLFCFQLLFSFLLATFFYLQLASAPDSHIFFDCDVNFRREAFTRLISRNLVSSCTFLHALQFQLWFTSVELALRNYSTTRDVSCFKRVASRLPAHLTH